MDKNIPAWSSYSQPDVNKLRLNTTSLGQGKPVLLIHGFGASSYSWRFVTETLAKNHRVITVDLKGFGDSPKPRDKRYSVYDQARLIRNYIVYNKLENLTIIGHSFGGGVALVTSFYLSQSHPDLQEKLILLDSVAYDQPLPDFAELLATPILGSLLVSLVPNKTQVRKLLKEVYYDDDKIPQQAIDHYALVMDKPNAKYALVIGARQLIPKDLDAFSNNYQRLQTPTLIVWGREDEIIPLSIGQRLHNDLPNSQFIVIDNAGHAIHEEDPARILPLIQRFLDSAQ